MQVPDFGCVGVLVDAKPEAIAWYERFGFESSTLLDDVWTFEYAYVAMTIVPDVLPLAKLLKALADETRLRIVALLAHGELCVCHVESGLDIPQPTASRHLAVLRHAGVVEARRDGSWIHYQLAAQADPASERVLQALVAEFGHADVLASDVQRLRATKGPTSCR